MVIYLLKNDALDLLKNATNDNVKKYSDDKSWLKEFYNDENTPNYSFSSGIVCKDFELNKYDTKDDAENAIKVFTALRDLNIVQASDLRLWAYLSHEVYWKYMNKRWPILQADEDDEEDEKNPQGKIKSRYFFGNSRGKGYVRHGIARLWWAAYLTYDESNQEDPFEYTKFILSKQDIFSGTTERGLARNKILLLAILTELKKHELSREQIRLFMRKINQAGGIILLDSLRKDQAEDLVKETLIKVIESKHS